MRCCFVMDREMIATSICRKKNNRFEFHRRLQITKETWKKKPEDTTFESLWHDNNQIEDTNSNKSVYI